MSGSRIYAGGNERVPVRLNSKLKYGIDPGWGTMGGEAELMSENSKPITLYATMLFEYVPKSTPGYKEARLVWVDVTNCAATSDFKPDKGVYVKQSQGFTMRHDGDLLFATGHMHDGGDYIKATVNGEEYCTSKAVYGQAGASTVIDGQEWKTISKMTICDKEMAVKKGDM